MKYKLLRWQEECLEHWKANKFRGIINVVTGAGKTVLALGAVEMLLDTIGGRNLKIRIVVPKTFLMYQWYSALNEDLSIPHQDIGFYSGTHKSEVPRKFMIYVINSARYTLSRHIADEIKNGDQVFLIADECHHYGSEENSKIFNFISHIPCDAQIYTLGLSATPSCKNYHDVLIPALGREIYRFTFFNALKADVISKFNIFNICVPFDFDEAYEYEDLSEKLGIALMQLKKKHPSLYSRNSYEFYSELDRIIKTSDDESAALAKAVLFLSIKRKEIVYLARSRISCVVNLIRLINKTSKIIIFSERIETAEILFQELSPLYPNEVGIYHSKLFKNTAKNTLRQFENFEIRILISCKTLDEGLNVSETDVGIIVSSTGSRRQRIQRLGRVLRKKLNNRPACFYYLFVGESSEENGLLKEMTDRSIGEMVNVIDLNYDKEADTFTNPYYQNLVTAVVSNITESGHDNDKIEEFLRNAQLGLLTADWLETQIDCIKKIKSASSKTERNYFITMLLLIRVRHTVSVIQIYNNDK